MPRDLLRKIKAEGLTQEADDIAKKEADTLAKEKDLQKDALQKEHNRKQELKDMLVLGIKIMFFLALMAVILMIASWVYHLLTPTSLHFLNKSQLGKIETMLFSGLTAGVISRIGKKYFLN